MRRTQTVQATAKAWKLLQGLGCMGVLAALTILGFGVALAREASQYERARVASTVGILLAIALPVYVVGRVGAWWFHG